MKLLLINFYLHRKNLEALQSYGFHIESIPIENIHNTDLSKYDAVYSPSQPIDVKLYPNTRFIFGPHFSVFPNANDIERILDHNTIYILPSEWTKTFWKTFDICTNLNMKVIPFGVDTDRFKDSKSITERNKVLVYYKHRHPDDLNTVLSFLQSMKIEYRLFSYTQNYSEEDFRTYLQECKYAIWVGCSESQGFALEETLSCNVPILVWNVFSLTQEYGQNYPHYDATTIPYWSEECGEYFYNAEELKPAYNLFISKLHQYSPRNYILNNLSREKCKKKFMQLLDAFVEPA